MTEPRVDRINGASLIGGRIFFCDFVFAQRLQRILLQTAAVIALNRPEKADDENGCENQTDENGERENLHDVFPVS